MLYAAGESPYYALLLDENDRFLDSHMIGMEGLLFHRDPWDPDVLHLWLLSPGRHALVGHYRMAFQGGWLSK